MSEILPSTIAAMRADLSDARHGTYTGYTAYTCSCDRCLIAKRVYMRDAKAAKKKTSTVEHSRAADQADFRRDMRARIAARKFAVPPVAAAPVLSSRAPTNPPVGAQNLTKQGEL